VNSLDPFLKYGCGIGTAWGILLSLVLVAAGVPSRWVIVIAVIIAIIATYDFGRTIERFRQEGQR
jgi:predicted metal-binding membrane protein